MRGIYFLAILAGTALTLAGTTSIGGQQPAQSQVPAQGPAQGSGRLGSGMARFPGGGGGIRGFVTEVASDHYTIKTDAGESYIVHFSANTRIMKGGGGRRNGEGGGRPRSADASSDAGRDTSRDSDRPTPQALKPSDIKVGDAITAAGEVDSAAKSIGAVFIVQIDPERVKQMREMEANYGKTWLAGRITGIEGTTITIEGMMDHASHAIEVDENTSFRQRRDSITMADIKPGQQLRAEGALQNGVFRATTVTANNVPSNPGSGPDFRPGPPPPGPAAAQPNPK
jgi:hypothetical protein